LSFGFIGALYDGQAAHRLQLKRPYGGVRGPAITFTITITRGEKDQAEMP